MSFAGWGEWFLHKDFPVMLRLLDKENIPCDFITNATLLGVEALKPLLKPGNLIVKIGVSMDSPTTGRIREYPGISGERKGAKQCEAANKGQEGKELKLAPDKV